MASEGPNSPGTMGVDTSVGSYTWDNPNNAKVSDNTYAQVSFIDVANQDKEHSIKLVKGGTIQGDDKTTSAVIPTTETYVSYGGAEDLWGLELTSSDINSSDFGVGFSVRIQDSPTYIWYYLKATNFGFTIPEGATINGVLVEIEQYQFAPYRWATRVDHIRITVYYTEVATGTNMQINIGDAWKAVPAMKINIGDTWKDVASAKINIGDTWKTIF